MGISGVELACEVGENAGDGISTNPVGVTDGVAVGRPLVTEATFPGVTIGVGVCARVADAGGAAAGGPCRICAETPTNTAATTNTTLMKNDRRATESLSWRNL